MQPAGAYAEVRWVRARVSKHCAKDYCIGMSWGFCGDVQSGLLMTTVICMELGMAGWVQLRDALK